MTEFLTTASNLPFAASLGVTVALSVLYGAGFGTGQEPDAEAGHGAGGALSWLGIGRAPLAIVLILLFGSFALIGYGAQVAASQLTGALLPAWLAAPVAFLLALPVTRAGANVIERIVPSVDSTAIHRDALLGRRAVVSIGRAAPGSPAQARVRDMHGAVHYVMIEPEHGYHAINAGEEALLVRRDGERFLAIPATPHPLLSPIERSVQ